MRICSNYPTTKVFYFKIAQSGDVTSELNARRETFGGEIKLLLPHIKCLSHPHLVGKVRNDAWFVWGDENILGALI